MKKQMKKLFLGSLLAVCTLLMTSCLDGGNNETQNFAYGIIDYSEKTLKPIIYSTHGPFYSAQIEKSFFEGKLDRGDCCYFHYILNMDIPENSSESTSVNEYYTVTVDDYFDIPQGRLSSSLQDTTIIAPEEMLVSLIDSDNSGFLATKKDIQMLLIATIHEDYDKNQEQEFSLSYDVDQEPELVNGENVYNLYLRVVKTKEGEKSLSSKQGFINAFNITQFLNTMKYKGEKKVNVRVNCIESLNEEKTEIADWVSSNVLTYTFPKEE